MSKVVLHTIRCTTFMICITYKTCILKWRQQPWFLMCRFSWNLYDWHVKKMTTSNRKESSLTNWATGIFFGAWDYKENNIHHSTCFILYTVNESPTIWYWKGKIYRLLGDNSYIISKKKMSRFLHIYIILKKYKLSTYLRKYIFFEHRYWLTVNEMPW